MCILFAFHLLYVVVVVCRVTQESSWSRPACMGFGTSRSSSLKNLEKEKSISLLNAAFGGENEEDENKTEENDTPNDLNRQQKEPNKPAPSPPKKLGEVKRDNSQYFTSFDSNDAFFAQLEEEVDEMNDKISEEEKMRLKKLEEEETMRREAKLKEIESVETNSQADVGKQHVDPSSDVSDEVEDEVPDLTSSLPEDHDMVSNSEDIPDNSVPNEIEEDVIDMTNSSLTEDKTPQEVEEDSEVKVVKEIQDNIIIKSSEVEDSVQQNESAIKLQSLHRRKHAQKEVDQLKKRRDDCLARQERKGQIDASKENESAIKLQSLHRRNHAQKEVEKLKKQCRDEFLAQQKQRGQNDASKKNESAIKLQSLHRRNHAQKEVDQLKKKRRDEFLALQEQSGQNDASKKNESAIKLQSLHRRNHAQKEVDQLKKKRRDEFLALQEQSGQNDASKKNESAIKLQSLHRRNHAQKEVEKLKKQCRDEFLAQQKQRGQNDASKENESAIKLQSLHRRNHAQKEVDQLKKKRHDEFLARQERNENESAIKLQSLHRRNHARQEVNRLKKKRHDEHLALQEEKEHDATAFPLKKEEGGSKVMKGGNSSHESRRGVEITEIRRPSVEIPDSSSDFDGADKPPHKQVSLSKKKMKVNAPKKDSRSNPKRAIDEAAKFLQNLDEISPSKPKVPETRSDELELPKIITTQNKIEPAPRRKNRGKDLQHVNKRAIESLEKLDKVAKETAPMESQSAPPDGILPPIK